MHQVSRGIVHVLTSIAVLKRLNALTNTLRITSRVDAGKQAIAVTVTRNFVFRYGTPPDRDTTSFADQRLLVDRLIWRRKVKVVLKETGERGVWDLGLGQR